MVFVKRFAAVLSVAALAAWSGALVQAQAPDLILHNGKVVTVDPAFSMAEGVAIRGDRFVAVGTNDAVRRTAGPATRVIDLRGRTVIPGLIDSPRSRRGSR
jgi:adenine deaminase